MSSTLMNIGKSGLSAAQLKLDVIGNNISNSKTDGYNRQTLGLAQTVGRSSNAGYIGSGVYVASVDRVYDNLIATQLRDSQSGSSALESYYNEMVKINDLFADSTNGLSNQIQTFFASLNNVVNNAGLSSSRETFISDAKSLVNQFNVTDKYLTDLESNINSQLDSSVTQINDYAQKIADLNKKIHYLTAVGNGNEPSSLLDERDTLLGELNKIVAVTVNQQDGSYNLSLANGFQLVQGDNVSKLIVSPSNADVSKSTVKYQHASGALSELSSTSLGSGSLKGVLEFRETSLTDTRNQLGQLALAIAYSFNQQQQAGVDYDGVTGGDLFSYAPPQAVAHTKNTGTSSLTTSYTDISKVQASNYSLTYNGSSWQVKRLSDNTAITPTVSGDTLSFDGLQVTITGAAAAKDSFTLETVNNVAASLSLAFTDGNKIAAGIGDSENGKSDNRNAQKMLALQNEKIIGGSASFNDAFAALVNRIGTLTASAETNLSVQDNIVSALNDQYQAVSGVNLDEEYINLQIYLEYYQANAQVIQTATTLFDTILNLR